MMSLALRHRHVGQFETGDVVVHKYTDFQIKWGAQ